MANVKFRRPSANHRYGGLGLQTPRSCRINFLVHRALCNHSDCECVKFDTCTKGKCALSTIYWPDESGHATPPSKERFFIVCTSQLSKGFCSLMYHVSNSIVVLKNILHSFLYISDFHIVRADTGNILFQTMIHDIKPWRETKVFELDLC